MGSFKSTLGSQHKLLGLAFDPSSGRGAQPAYRRQGLTPFETIFGMEGSDYEGQAITEIHC